MTQKDNPMIDISTHMPPIVESETTGKKELKDIYQMTEFDKNSGIALFGLRDLKDIMHSGSFNMYMKMPEALKSKSEVVAWLNQEGEDSGWIDVDLKYKLLKKARDWKQSQDNYNEDHPKVTLATANAQEEYNLTVLAEQTRLISEFRMPQSIPMEHM